MSFPGLPPPQKKKRRRRARFRLDPTGPFPFLLNMAFQLLCALLRRCGTARGVKGCCSFGLSHISSCMWEQTLPILIVRPREGITSCDGTGFLLLRSSTDSSPKASGGRTLPWGESAPSPQLQKRRVGSFWTPIGEELLIRAQPEKAGLGKKKKGPVGSERCTPRRLWRFEFGVQRLGENIVEPTAADRSRPQSKWIGKAERVGLTRRNGKTAGGHRVWSGKRRPSRGGLRFGWVRHPALKNRTALCTTAGKKGRISPRSLVLPLRGAWTSGSSSTGLALTASSAQKDFPSALTYRNDPRRNSAPVQCSSAPLDRGVFRSVVLGVLPVKARSTFGPPAVPVRKAKAVGGWGELSLSAVYSPRRWQQWRGFRGPSGVLGAVLPPRGQIDLLSSGEEVRLWVTDALGVLRRGAIAAKNGWRWGA